MADDTSSMLPLSTFVDKDSDSPERISRRDKSSDTNRHLPEALARGQERGEGGDFSPPLSSNMHLPRIFSDCFPPPSEGGREMRWGFWSVDDHQWIKRVEDNYNRRHCNSSSPTNTLWRIPRIIHHIWLGGELPRAFARLRNTWQSRHEGWELRLWTDSDVETFGLENREAYDAAENFGEKSDILRYEILLRQGGLYVDVDFLCLGAFDYLHRRYDFYAGVSNTGTFELNNGLVGCRPGHPIMRTLVTRIRGSCSPRPPAGMRGDCGGGPFSSEVGNITSCLTTALTGKSMLLTRTEDTEDASPAMRASWTTGRGVAVDRTEAEMGISIGDPLAAVVKAFGDGKGREHSVTTGESGTNEVLRGLLAGLLADEDRERLDQAVQVPPGSAMATITRTGPGAFTLTVMEWMCNVNTAGDAEAIRDNGTYSNDKVLTPSADGADWVEPEPAAVMILPPSYFYPVPNDVEGDLVGDGNEAGVIDRIGRYFSRESLAAHLWAKSWQ